MAASGPPLLGTRGLPVSAPLAGLFPERQLRLGSVLGLTGLGGSVPLLLALVSEAMAAGSWAAVVAMPALGVEAAADLGAPLDRLALVPEPGDHWPEVIGALLDAVDLVAVAPPGRCRAADARRLAARARERHSVLVVIEPTVLGPTSLGPTSLGPTSLGPTVLGPTSLGPTSLGPTKLAFLWPEPVDLSLQVTSAVWEGLDRGDGALRRRHMTVRSSGRRSAGRQRTVTVWLPAADGRLQVVDTSPDLAPRNPQQVEAGSHGQPTVAPLQAKATMLQAAADPNGRLQVAIARRRPVASPQTAVRSTLAATPPRQPLGR